MTFPESLEWLYATQQFGIKLGLENTRRLLEALGDPQERLKIVHVAGTNGKGSVCAMVDAISRASGRRTGLYTSPHLVDFRERIRVDGVKIPAEAVSDLLTDIRRISEGWEHLPTFFEITTALALSYFATQQCDLVVLETGMGGRLDSTNAVLPLVSVITPIALDHTQWLGETVEAVAGEKAGIIKSYVPVVSASQDAGAERVLSEAAAEVSAPIRFVREALKGCEVNLYGAFQKHNAALAVEVFRTAGLDVDERAVQDGLRRVQWPGRFHEHAGRFVLDGGHNPHAVTYLVQNWRERFGDEKAFVIFGAMADKDYPRMLAILSPIANEFLMVPVKSARAAAPSALAAEHQPSRVADSLEEALAEARTAKGRILVTGSLFLVGEAMALLGIEP